SRFARMQLVVQGMALSAAMPVPVAAFITATQMPPCHQHEEEKFFLNAKGQMETLPSIWDSPTGPHGVSVTSTSHTEGERCCWLLCPL
uniref:Uncharacterized protein n=1 Tax=Peromyscus maniculatus bairdii TaxID=230844 RepID=A0A8C8UIA5_PERMB